MIETLLFFHRVAKFKKVSRQMSILKNGDSVLADNDSIEQHVLYFYTSLYAAENSCVDNGLIEKAVPSMVTNQENVMLTNLPSLEEVNAAVFSMNGQGAPSPDGFGGSFFQEHWNTIQHDVFNSVLQFFKHSWLLPNINSNLDE